MNTNLEKWVLALGIAGFAFSGYLSAVKFFSNTCAFGESCPYFLGFPACYFGFVMFTVITLAALFRVLQKGRSSDNNQIILLTSILGILFAGYFTVRELPILLSKGLTAYMLGLPTCAMGLIFYIIIFMLSYKLRAHATNAG